MCIFVHKTLFSVSSVCSVVKKDFMRLPWKITSIHDDKKRSVKGGRGLPCLFTMP